SSLAKTAPGFGLGKAVRNAAQQPRAGTAYSPTPVTQTPALNIQTYNSGGGSSSAVSPPMLLESSGSTPDIAHHDHLVERLQSPRSSQDEIIDHRIATVPAPTSTAAATTDTAHAVQCLSCL
ncbi:unnamed protein product, partial [Laminaria digitata]